MQQARVCRLGLQSWRLGNGQSGLYVPRLRPDVRRRLDIALGLPVWRGLWSVPGCFIMATARACIAVFGSPTPCHLSTPIQINECSQPRLVCNCMPGFSGLNCELGPNGTIESAALVPRQPPLPNLDANNTVVPSNTVLIGSGVGFCAPLFNWTNLTSELAFNESIRSNHSCSGALTRLMPVSPALVFRHPTIAAMPPSHGHHH